MKSFSDLPIPLPAGSQKVWRITVGKSSDTRSVQIHCNNVEVLNVKISDSLCEVATWKSYWMKDRVAIVFPSSDTASNFYRPYTGDKIHQDIKCFGHPRILCSQLHEHYLKVRAINNWQVTTITFISLSVLGSRLKLKE